MKAGCIPLTALNDYIADGTVNVEENSIHIGGFAYGKMNCFHRQVDSSQENFTFYDALQARGKDDSSLIDSNFSLFFNNPEHGLICLRKTLDLNLNPTAATVDNNQVIFNDPFFDFSAWSKCKTIFVMLPYSAMKCLMAGKNLTKRSKRKIAKNITEHLSCCMHHS